jgi:hypothetical protein
MQYVLPKRRCIPTNPQRSTTQMTLIDVSAVRNSNFMKEKTFPAHSTQNVTDVPLRWFTDSRLDSEFIVQKRVLLSRVFRVTRGVILALRLGRFSV